MRIVTLVLAGFMAASAASAAPLNVKQKLKRLDTNGDGRLSLRECLTGQTNKPPRRVEALFRKIDRDQDGYLTFAEIKAHQAKKSRD